MVPKLIKMIEEGTPEDRQNAAREICQRRQSDLIPDLIVLLDHQDDEVREIVAVVIGVLGGQSAESALETISKNDMSTNVRIAAIISKQYSGKLTYDLMLSEIKRFKMNSSVNEDKGESGVEAEPEPVKTKPEEKRPNVVTLADLEAAAENDDKRGGFLGSLTANKVRILFPLASVLAIIAILMIFSGDDGTVVPGSKNIPKGSALVGDRIMDRIAAISEFKTRWLNPDMPESRYPMTLELRSIAGDTYGSLFEKVYSNILPTNDGMNVLGAFWRHLNFAEAGLQNDIDLMDRETSEELLLFPNLPGLNLMLKAEEGDLAFSSIYTDDPELDIEIEIESVIIQ